MVAEPLLSWMTELSGPGGSDLYITVGAPATLRGESGFTLLTEHPLSVDEVESVIAQLLSDAQNADFDTNCEFNMAMALEGLGRFRLNLFVQRQLPGLVIRKITTEIPTLSGLNLPGLLGDIALEKRGLIFVVGATGSGKSTTLAAMLGHRNEAAPGHIITIEDPVEYVHEHRQCIVTQREVGVDTRTFDIALKNALRQKPDVILIGEIRDMHTMEHAINIAETGHLCLATLHANNANQAIERVVNFFPQESHHQVLLNLSLNLRAIVSQRLVRTTDNKRAAALEILLNQGLIKELIRKGEVKEIKPVMAENRASGMQTFDQALLDLYKAGRIEEEVALAEADNAGDLKLMMRSASFAEGEKGLESVDTSKLSL